MPGTTIRNGALAPIAAILALACAQGDAHTTDGPADGREATAARQPAHVDSILPVEEELRRFRTSIEREPDRLGGHTAPSIGALVAEFVRAVEQSDTAALRGMIIDRAEFAYLYYPHTRHTRKPWKLSPALLWFQLQQNGEKGIVRALRLYAGSRSALGPHECATGPVVEGPNRLWQECRVSVGTGENREWKRVFGSIIERDGLYKFVSYANDL